MRRSICALLLLAAASPQAVAASLASASPRARLAALRQGELGGALVGGEMASVSWDGLAPAGTEEWEAFFSLDGGATFPIRLTPHLDLAVRSFRFRVPDFPTRDGRLLLRFGDEKVETVVPGLDRVTIAKGVLQPLPPLMSIRPGEPVLPGRHGVVFWTEGTRRGGHLETYAAAENGSSLRGVTSAPPLWLPLAGPRAPRTLVPLPAGRLRALLERTGSNPEPDLQPRGASLPVRLLIGRRNE